MWLRADIHVEGRTRHQIWDATASSAVSVKRPIAVEIVEESGAAFLLRLDERGDCVADTWHQDVAAAKSQASFEYGIGDEDWVAIA